MTDAVARVRIWLVVVLVSVGGVVWLLPATSQSDVAGRSPYLQVSFLDVGQGDAILIRTPDGAEALIDGGRDGTVLQRLRTTHGWFERSLSLMVATHYDGDHIGGLDDVLASYRVEMVLVAGNDTGSEDAARFTEAVGAEGLAPHVVRAGDLVQLGASTTLEILSPTYDVADIESNNSSIVLLVHYGETAFLLTGDAPKEIETYLVAKYGDQLAADVLKLGHHGSRTSSDQLFLETVDPLYAVVSAGKDNTYGHPHEEVVESVLRQQIVLLETAKAGTITFLSDGERVWVE